MEALHESDVRVSLVAEQDGRPVGFIMARVDFGEFGRFEPTAVMDTIGVDPDYRDRGIGRALLSQLLINLTDAARRAHPDGNRLAGSRAPRVPRQLRLSTLATALL